jgi:hypothetical protein
MPIQGRTEHLYFAPKPLYVAMLNGNGLGGHERSVVVPAPETPARSKDGHDDLEEEKVGSSAFQPWVLSLISYRPPPRNVSGATLPSSKPNWQKSIFRQTSPPPSSNECSILTSKTWIQYRWILKLVIRATSRGCTSTTRRVIWVASFWGCSGEFLSSGSFR